MHARLLLAVVPLLACAAAPLTAQSAHPQDSLLHASASTSGHGAPSPRPAPAPGPAPAPRPAASPTPEQVRARVAAHKGDFDYLLGDWEFDARSRQYGPGRGYWSAARLAGDGQVLDEFRIVGDSGQTLHVTSTVRSYNALRDRWDLISVGEPNGLQDFGTGQRVGDEVHIEQSFGVGGPYPSRLRIRYYDIQPDHFSWNADCSQDGGRTWVRDCSHIEAHRIGPARSVAPLAGAGHVK